MNRRTRRLLLEIVVAIVLTVLLRALSLDEWTLAHTGFAFSLVLLPTIWLALRHGGPAASVAGAIAGLINFLVFAPKDLSIVQQINIELTPLIFVGVAGFFAKYTQKTLNNRRFSSTQLNIATATLIATLIYYIMKYIVNPYLTNGAVVALKVAALQFWVSWLVSAVVIAVILIVIARTQPSWIIPKRSKYLSRKETSSLLND